MDVLTEPSTYVSLVTLTALEVVLGIDNVVFLSIMAGKLPPEQQPRIRRLGLSLALLIRIVLLLALSWVMGLTAPLFTVLGQELSGRDLILLGGGLFLVGKATHEIYDHLEVPHAEEATGGSGSARWLVLLQILALDVVFSLDSVITAIGMAQHVAVMVAAMVIAMLVMLAFAGSIGDFIERHPSMKILALSFLLMIGVMLIAEALGQHIDKGYAYFAMAFSLGVEVLNMRMRKKAAPLALHHRFEQTLHAPPPAPQGNTGRPSPQQVGS